MSFLKFTVFVLKQKHFSFIHKRLASSKVKVRFAPSPTGFLHLGGLRTALYNHLFAKSQNGASILRIEDTDLSRTVPMATENIIEDLAWFGITFDEGPYFQSERKEIYQKHAEQLIEQGDAYYCFCSKVRLDLIRKEAFKRREIPKYDGCCRNLSKEEVENNLKTKPACVRFKLTRTKESFDDLLLGPTKELDIAGQEGDFVLLKTDGFPTYHFANVVDDHLMEISHVLRGLEWLMSTPKHILLYRAFKWDPPKFGHLPLLMNANGTKLSKRHGDFLVKSLREAGYFPNSIINFIARIGGGFEIKTEKNFKIYTLDELAEKFNPSNIKVASGKVNSELLPLYNSAEFLRQFKSSNERQSIVNKVKEIIQKHYPKSLLNDEKVEDILEIIKHRITRLEDILDENYKFLWVWKNNWDEEHEVYNEIIKTLLVKIEEVNWTSEEITKFLKTFGSSFKEFKNSFVLQIIRFALTGYKQGLPVSEIMSFLPKEEVQLRLSEILQPKSKTDVNRN